MSKLKILIVEDEPLAAVQLASLIATIRPNAEVIAVCDTIEATVNWINKHEKPDLAFFDIHLGDGLSFEIFKKVDFTTPIIFTTAYNQYALQAFKVNSIDYILKPIDAIELKTAIEKFENTNVSASRKLTDQQLNTIIGSINQKDYKHRFLVKVGTQLRAVNTNDILYFFSFQKGTYLKTTNNKNYLLDQTLELIEQLIDPNKFFRINRKYLISIEAIQNVAVYSNSRLKLKVNLAEEDDFLVAREKVKSFKSWLDGEFT